MIEMFEALISFDLSLALSICTIKKFCFCAAHLDSIAHYPWYAATTAVLIKMNIEFREWSADIWPGFICIWLT